MRIIFFVKIAQSVATEISHFYTIDYFLKSFSIKFFINDFLGETNIWHYFVRIQARRTNIAFIYFSYIFSFISWLLIKFSSDLKKKYSTFQEIHKVRKFWEIWFNWISWTSVSYYINRISINFIIYFINNYLLGVFHDKHV